MKPDTLQKTQEKIAVIEREIRETPYHKGTEHHIGRLKAKLAKLRSSEQQIIKSGGGGGFAVKKAGDATIVLVGPPSVGKSTLLNRLTNAHAAVASWPFTTTTVIPGMMLYQGAQIQIFDLPGIIGGAARGIGRGREVLSVARLADLLLLVVDITTRGKIDSILHELKTAGIKTPYCLVFNKIDLVDDSRKSWDKQIPISAEKNLGLEELKKEIWRQLGLLRIYLKPRWGKPDKEKPLIMKKGSRVSDVAKRIFPNQEFTRIILWGPSARFPEQPVSLDHFLKDEDILRFELKTEQLDSS